MMNKNEAKYYFTSADNTVDIVLLNNVYTSYPVHTHAEHYTMGLVIDGQIIIRTDKDNYICESNNIFTIPVDVSHSIKPICERPYTMLSLCVHQDYLIYTDIDSIKNMMELQLNRLFASKEIVSEYLELLSDGLMILLSYRMKNITNDSYTKIIKHKLLETPETYLSIDDMANEICISSFHMIRQFKKDVGLTPHQFQIQCRIRKAQKMLLSNKTIAEVALDMGFFDQSHFVKCFKKIVGMTPASYQKMLNSAKSRNKFCKK